MYYQPLHFTNFTEITAQLQDLYRDFEHHGFNNPLDKVRPYSEIIQNCPDLHRQLVEYNLHVKHAFLFQRVTTDPNIDIHTDLDQPGPFIALNWPIFNCSNSWMNFFKVTDCNQGDLLLHNEYQQFYKKFPSENCELVDQVELTSPYLLDISQPHNVYSLTENRRLIISFRFIANPDNLWIR